MRPGRVDDARLPRHRASTAPSCRRRTTTTSLTTTDAAYDADREDLLILYRPLFFTSYMLADQLEDNAFFGASVVALSSASSKTAYGAAFLLQGKGPEVVGLTSPGNVEFTESLGCYDRVVAYDAVSELDAGTPTAYLDVAGNAELREQLARAPRRSARARRGRRCDAPGAGRRRGARPAHVASSSRPTRCASAPATGAGRCSTNASPRRGTRFAPTVEGWVDVVDARRARSAARRVARGALGRELAAGRKRADALTREVRSVP